MTFLRRSGLPERLLAILLLVAGVDFAANTLLFDRASRFALREDDAARVAEHLVIASRAIERTPAAEREKITRELSTPRFSLRWSERGPRPAGSVALGTMREQILDITGEFDHADLQLHLKPLGSPGNVVGSVLLSDRSVLTFQTYASDAWTLNAGRIATLLLPTLVLVVLAWVLFRATLAPLGVLVRATRKVGSDTPEAVAEQGTDEVRELIRAFNQMQQRIHRSMTDRMQSMLAIGHDLRTPLARMQLRLENAGLDAQTRDEMAVDLGEMRHMLESLQAFVESGGSRLPAERVDVAVMAQTLVDTAADEGRDAYFHGLESLEIMARPVSLRRALSNLLENALHYAGNVHVTVRRDGDMAEIVFEDDGPGIPEDRLDDVLQPFVRLDVARKRDTPGMGLGLPIVSRAVKLEGGSLDLRNKPGGGLAVTVRLPCATS
ncbi:periplasmic sensor signal transduction histidine kinase [Novosphingobium aromaticivorans DSM 12444]|uniref:histidine kinase n=1 Tax=Novosphingobium aromaticivorans (strain ATCC 700278 / DSM 12444 / CCUG 56034 / CIP 105152 / NBRC 16084 / F199) TaxID=279238 RepID=Q2G519_NOVAD|nr:ATP-binding protein [Novosphingobium aromaticivorans]ABD27054.1 periplasmic sensor signal transduction histidine kinase [Novosphingobium aromaticivorans DSM 12444]SCY49131.1 Signal transduction histidine kinase [Novosphingobium aromaticivorans]